MILRYTFCFLFVLLCFAACKTDTPNNDNTRTVSNGTLDYPHLASSYCDCAAASIALNDKMKALLDAGDDQAFNGLVNEAQVNFDKAIRCASDARKKHAAADLDKKKMGTALKKVCPQMPPRLTLEILDKVR